MAPVSAPIHFLAVRDSHVGSVKLKWKAVTGAVMYQVQITTGDPSTYDDNWEVVKMTAQVRTLVEDLTPGTTYVFRVKTLGKKGESAWSDISVVMAA